MQLPPQVPVPSSFSVEARGHGLTVSGETTLSDAVIAGYRVAIGGEILSAQGGKFRRTPAFLYAVTKHDNAAKPAPPHGMTTATRALAAGVWRSGR
jgi:hypothetical protein